MVRDPTHHPLPLYLKGKTVIRMKRWSEAHEVLSGVRMYEPYLEALRLRMMGLALYRLRRFEEAKACFWRSLNFSATEVARLDVDDWVERCDWTKEYFGRMGQ
jgi:hypothetical protein